MGHSTDPQIKWPAGDADEQALSATGAQALTIDDDMTVIDGVTTEATAARTIDLTITTGVKKGAMILLKSKTNGTENTVFGTGITAPTFAGVAGKTFTQGFQFDGTVFLPQGAAVQID